MSSPLTDDFDRTNSADINANNPHPGWTWTDVSGTYSIVSNKLSLTGILTASSLRAESDLSADHEASIDVTVNADAGGNAQGVMVRHAAAAISGYLVRIRNVSGTVTLQMFRYDTGTPTQLGSDVDITSSYVAGRTVKARAVGTAISGYYNGVLLIGPITDANYSNLRTGMRGFCNVSGDVLGDNFLAADVGGAKTPLALLMSGA